MRNYFNSYFETALRLVTDYNGLQPLNNFLKTYFSQHKKHGSKDRKWITHFCYCYYRLGFALKNLSNEERLRVAVLLCTAKEDNWLFLYDDKWQKFYDENINKRILFTQSLYPFKVEDIFFNNQDVSKNIDVADFNKSHLIQPDLFIRIRPGNEKKVVDKLLQNSILFDQKNQSCLALPNAVKIDGIIELNKEAVIQDYASQQVASFFKLISSDMPLYIWDCCAASGGKSILAFDYFFKSKITVSDIRSSIIQNLQKRFQQAGIQQYSSFVADISSPQFAIKQQYDLVICDAPCSGSGTWSRTPEQLFFFTIDKLFHYTQLQKKIATNAVKAVKKNGYFLYITCSVFKQENGELVDFILQTSQLKLVELNVIKGYQEKADTMFAALFINP